MSDAPQSGKVSSPATTGEGGFYSIFSISLVEIGMCTHFKVFWGPFSKSCFSASLSLWSKHSSLLTWARVRCLVLCILFLLVTRGCIY